MVWPALATSRWASSSMAPSTAVANRRSRRARSPGATSRHVSNALRARLIAMSVSVASSCGTVVTDCSVAGLMTSYDVVTVASLLHALERTDALPVGDRSVEGGDLDPGSVGVVVDHGVTQRGSRQLALVEQSCRFVQRCRHPRRVGDVGMARVRLVERELLIDAVQPGRDHRRHCEVGVDVAAGDAVLEAEAGPLTDHAQRAGAVVQTPLDGGRREGPRLITLVGVDVRREEVAQLTQSAELPGEEVLENRRHATGAITGEHRVAVLVAQRQVYVAGVALPLVVLRHEGQRRPVLRGDLLRTVLVDDVVVAGAKGVGVLERDLMLARVALALRRLDLHTRVAHAQPDRPQQRLDPARAEDRVVDVVLVGRREVGVSLGPRRLEAVIEDDELELGADHRHPTPLGQPLHLLLEDLAGRLHDWRVIEPAGIAEQQRRPRLPGDAAHRGEVWMDGKVAVAAFPR